MKIREFFKNNTAKTVAILLIVAVFLGFVGFMTSQFISQKKMLREMELEKQRLSDRIDELLREQERLQSDLEYVKSPEGLLQYARDHLGYIFPGDERIGEGE